MRSSEKEVQAPSPKRTIVVKSPPIKKRKSTYEGYEYETDDDDVTYFIYLNLYFIIFIKA